jgi:mono/diheme cytochrome c family protein
VFQPRNPSPRFPRFLLTLTALAGFAFQGRSAPAPTFETDIHPIFKAYCFHCHGEEEKLQGGLDLRLRKLIERGGKSGSVLTPGNHRASRLFEVVQSGEMPPKEELTLKPEEVDLIARWIDAGAPTAQLEPESLPEPGDFIITAAERSHWAYQPIKRPGIPAARFTSEIPEPAPLRHATRGTRHGPTTPSTPSSASA